MPGKFEPLYNYIILVGIDPGQFGHTQDSLLEEGPGRNVYQVPFQEPDLFVLMPFDTLGSFVIGENFFQVCAVKLEVKNMFMHLNPCRKAKRGSEGTPDNLASALGFR